MCAICNLSNSHVEREKRERDRENREKELKKEKAIKDGFMCPECHSKMLQKVLGPGSTKKLYVYYSFVFLRT